MVTDPHFDDLFEDHMKALGALCSMWADYEFLINEMIWELANVDRKAGACITAQMVGPAPRLRALIALVHLRGGNEAILSDLRKLAREGRALGARRNRYVHDVFTITKEGEMQRVHVTADDTLQFDLIPTTVEELKGLYEEISAARIELAKARDRFIAELPTWPRTQFSQSLGIGTIPLTEAERASTHPHHGQSWPG